MPGRYRRPIRCRGYRGCIRSRMQMRCRRCSEGSHVKVLDDWKGNLISEEVKEVQ